MQKCGNMCEVLRLTNATMAVRLHLGTACLIIRSAVRQPAIQRLCTQRLCLSTWKYETGTSRIHSKPLLHPMGAHTLQERSGYAKKAKREKQDRKRGKTSSKVELSSEQLNEIIDHNKMEHQMELAVAHLKQEYIEQLSLRTSSGVFDNLQVETPDGKFPLIQLGQVAQKNPQLIVINLISAPQYISAVKHAIEKSGMNLNPQQEGTTLFIPVPKITKEHREGMAKNAKMLCDKAKEKIRDIQNRFLKDSKKAKDQHSEDLIRGVQDHVQTSAKAYMSQAEDMMQIKQKEMLGK